MTLYSIVKDPRDYIAKDTVSIALVKMLVKLHCQSVPTILLNGKYMKCILFLPGDLFSIRIIVS